MLRLHCVVWELREFLFLSEKFGDVFALAEFSDDVEVILGFEDVVEVEKVDCVFEFDGFEDGDFFVGELFAELVLLFEVDDFDGHDFV